MKKQMIAAVLMSALIGGGALVGTTLAAQGFGPKFDCDGSAVDSVAREARQERHFARMAAILDLTDAQQAQIKAIREASREKTAPLHEQLRESRDKLREAGKDGSFDEAAVRALASEQAAAKTELMVERARTRSQIHALLSDEQRELAEKLGAMRHADQGRSGRGGHRGDM